MTEISMPTGSVVQLKSGGPKMTITTYDKGLPVCIYFVDGKLEKLRLFKETLKLCEGE